MNKMLVKGILKVPLPELNLSLTLQSGQSFRWRQMSGDDGNDPIWIGVINDYVISLQQIIAENCINYKCYNYESSLNGKLNARKSKKRKLENESHDDNDYHRIIENVLSDYFQLGISLTQLYKRWSFADENFAKISDKFSGIRIMRQNPIENLFSFICSSNNNIQRISKMVESLCEKYGRELCRIDDYGTIYSFPDIQTLAMDNVENELRELAFGYRAKYINKSAKIIMEKHSDDPQSWVMSLRQLPYDDAHSQLMQLSGVGAKVADCICLMSLDKNDAIPVDTHVWQIAIKNYLPHLKSNKTLTAKAYKEIGDFFREKFGPYSGWAHSVLFCADLRQFNNK